MHQSQQENRDGGKYPILSFFPAVRFARNLELGEWAIGTPPDTVAWRSTPFRELAATLLESERNEFKKPGFLWHRVRGFDGSAPEDDEARAIQAAVRFALLDYNDQVSRDGYNLLHRDERERCHVSPADRRSRALCST